MRLEAYIRHDARKLCKDILKRYPQVESMTIILRFTAGSKVLENHPFTVRQEDVRAGRV
jgi:hypothetical protein